MSVQSKFKKLKWLVKHADRNAVSYAWRLIRSEGPVNFINMARVNLERRLNAAATYRTLSANFDEGNLNDGALITANSAEFVLAPEYLGAARIETATRNKGGTSARLTLKVQNMRGDILAAVTVKNPKHNGYTTFDFSPVHNAAPPYYFPEPLVFRFSSDTPGCGIIAKRAPDNGGLSQRDIFYKLYASPDPYIRWLEINTPSAEQLDAQRRRGFEFCPLISIAVPLYNTPENYLRDLINSVVAQTYGNWELCLADAGETNGEMARIVKGYGDSRIKLKALGSNRGISQNTNAAIDMSAGEYVCFLDHDDILAPHALYSNVELLNRDPAYDFIYSDEDKVSDDGITRQFPFFKPDFSPHTLLSFNYITHLTLIKKTLLDKTGALDPQYDGAQDYDLILRAVEKAEKIGHISDILYHWRKTPESTAEDASAKPETTETGRRAVQAALDRGQSQAKAVAGPYPNTYAVNYPLPNTAPLVSVIIPNHNQAATLKKCLTSIFEKTSYKNYEIIIVENNSNEKSLFRYYKTIETLPNVRILTYNKPFNYSALNNFAAEQANGELLLLLNNDIEAITPDWMERLAAYALQPDTGAVGAKLLYPDGRIQHAGVTLKVGGVAAHTLRMFGAKEPGHFNRLMTAYDVGAVTGACLMVKKSAYEQIGGFDENFTVAFNDVDLCVRLLEAGYKNVFEPRALLYHYESKSRGYETSPEKAERFNGECRLWLEKWDKKYPVDPYYNKNLSHMYLDFSVRRPDEQEYNYEYFCRKVKK